MANESTTRTLLMIGQNHRTTPIALREEIGIPEAEAENALAVLRATEGVEEVAILSTCNRSEIYAVTNTNYEQGVTLLEDYLAGQSTRSRAEIAPHLYRFEGADAARQLFLVVAGMDSMMIGESQIVGQVKGAFQRAGECGATGAILKRLFHHALEAGKRVRTDTTISEGAVSVASAAVSVVRRVFDRFESRAALIIGAGETAELAAKSLAHFGFGKIWIMNRSPERATELAGRVGGEAILWEELAAKLGQADAVFACTAATTPLIDVSLIRTASAERSHRRGPLFLVDLAVPRNIDPRVRESDSVFLYDLDDLQAMIEKNQKRRSQAAVQGRAIVDEEALKFDRWLLSLGAGESIRLLRNKWEGIHRAELDRIAKNLNPDERERMARFSHNVLKKILHGPTVRLRNGAGMSQNGDPDHEKTLRELFDLISEEDDS